MCPKDIIEKIQVMAALQRKEICGVVLKDNTIIPIKNVSSSHNTFVFDKREWFTLLNTKPDILCIYHSHLNGNTEPSETDLNCQNIIMYDFLIVAGNDWSYTPYA